MTRTQAIAPKSKFLTADDVAAILEVSPATANRKIKAMNDDLKQMNKLVIPGKVPRRFFEERIYL